MTATPARPARPATVPDASEFIRLATEWAETGCDPRSPLAGLVAGCGWPSGAARVAAVTVGPAVWAVTVERGRASGRQTSGR